MRKNKRAASILKTLGEASQKGGILRRLQSNLTGKERRNLQKAFHRLDHEFLLEKADLIKDTLSEVLRHRKETPNRLLQRNIFATLDAVALHLDCTGFGKVFQRMAPKLLAGVRFDDRQIIELEYQLLLDVLGGAEAVSRLGLLSFAEVEEVIRYAQNHRSGPHGIRRLARKDFSFQKMMAEHCCRPDKILDIVIHSPQASKGAIAITLAVVNLVSAIVAGLAFLFPDFTWSKAVAAVGAIVAVITFIIVYVLAGAGC